MKQENLPDGHKLILWSLTRWILLCDSPWITKEFILLPIAKILWSAFKSVEKKHGCLLLVKNIYWKKKILRLLLIFLLCHLPKDFCSGTTSRFITDTHHFTFITTFWWNYKTCTFDLRLFLKETVSMLALNLLDRFLPSVIGGFFYHDHHSSVTRTEECIWMYTYSLNVRKFHVLN